MMIDMLIVARSLRVAAVNSLLAVAVTSFALASPSDAEAARVSADTESGTDCQPHLSCTQYTNSRVAVVGAADAPERLTLTRTGDTVEVRTEGEPITAGPGCGLHDVVAVRCFVPGHVATLIALGAADDTVTVAGAGAGGDVVEVKAGAGADHISAGSGGSVFGEGGDDTIVLGEPGSVFAGSGADRVTGSASNDEISGGPGSDVLDGGAGTDVVSWEDATTPVSFDLATQGEAVGPEGDLDTAMGFEGARGGQADDVLRGDAGANMLDGGPGNDTVDGRDGNDALEGGDGDDRLDGGAGDDVLELDDQFSGGFGEDVGLGGEGNDRLHGGAEQPGERDYLDGGPGNDDLEASDEHSSTLFGGDGRDQLSGGGRADGGNGDDILRVSGGERVANRICGAGTDAMDFEFARSTTNVPDDCERVLGFETSLRASPLTTGPRIALPLSRRLCQVAPTCRVAVTFSDIAGARLGTARVTLTRGSSGKSAVVRVRRPLCGSRTIRVLVRVLANDADPVSGGTLRWSARTTARPSPSCPAS